MSKIKLLILDVDGVLTDGRLLYLNSGEEVKVFHVQDGAAMKLWRSYGGRAAFVSGRQSEAVDRRAKELGVDAVIQGVSDKVPVYEELRGRFGVSGSEIAVVGDDWADIPLIRRCGYGIAVANALAVVKQSATWVTRRRGGEGVVAEVVERLLRRNGVWPEVIRDRLGGPA